WRASAIGVLILALGVLGVWWALIGLPGPPVEDDRYVVFPFEHEGAPIPELEGDECEILLRDALARQWAGIKLVDEIRVGDIVSRDFPARATIRRRLEWARGLGARRAMWGSVTRVPN